MNRCVNTNRAKCGYLDLRFAAHLFWGHVQMRRRLDVAYLFISLALASTTYTPRTTTKENCAKNNRKLYLKIAASRQQRVCRRLAVTTARHSFRLVSEVIEVLAKLSPSGAEQQQVLRFAPVASKQCQLLYVAVCSRYCLCSWHCLCGCFRLCRKHCLR